MTDPVSKMREDAAKIADEAARQHISASATANKIAARIRALPLPAPAKGSGSAVFDYIVHGGDELAKRDAELEYALGVLGTELKEQNALRDQVARLCEALKPFADYPWDMLQDEGDDCVVAARFSSFEEFAGCITNGDVRRARQALSSIEGMKANEAKGG